MSPYGSVNVRLVGGPFDGDEGRLVFPPGSWDAMGPDLPESLWVWHCTETGCPYGQVHWQPEQKDAKPGSIEYVHEEAGEDEDGWEIYVFGGMARPLVGVGAEKGLVA